MEIVPGVHTIEGLGVGRPYLYQEADRVTLIDTVLATGQWDDSSMRKRSATE